MERKLATIRRIDGLKPIAKADLIEVAIIGGWEAVVRKGDFKVGDQCLYFEIDSFLPKADARFQAVMRSGVRTFNGVEGHKLRTVRLRGQLSQGLALPLALFPEVVALIGSVKQDLIDAMTDEQRARVKAFLDVNVFEDVMELDWAPIVGVVKWDPPLSAELAGQAAGLFPSFIRKTDQERCQNIREYIFGYADTTAPLDVGNIPEEALFAMADRGEAICINGVWNRLYEAKADPDTVYEITMKMDGSSFTAYVKDDGEGNPITGVCSRNLELKVSDENAGNSFVRMFIDSGLRDAMLEMYAKANIPDGRPFAFAVQGELMGPGIQGNREGFTENKLFVFDIYDINQGFYLPPFLRMDVVMNLQEFDAKIEHVPVLENCVKLEDLNLHTIEDLLKYAEGPSLNNPVREGVVFKRMDGQFSFKAISNLYLEQEKD